MQPWTEAALQLWQLSSSLAFAAQQQQQLSCYNSAAPAVQQVAAIPAQIAMQPCSRAALQPCSLAAMQPCSRAALQPCSLAVMQPCSRAALQPCSRAALQPCSPQSTALQPYSPPAIQPGCCKDQPCSQNKQPGSPAAPGSSPGALQF